MTTWTFQEASHGKGAADGIGTVVKRNADTQVNVHQNDITCARDFLQCVTSGSTSIKFFEVSKDVIMSIENGLLNTMLPVRNTMKVHNVPKGLCLSYWGFRQFNIRLINCRKVMLTVFLPIITIYRHIQN